MQDAHGASWLRDADVSREMRESVRELNRRFLDLVADHPAGWSASHSGMSTEVCARVAPLSPVQKAAAATCPYALFDLRFGDAHHWPARLEASAVWRVADAEANADALEFARLALFFAWHLASSSKLGAQVLLGMHDVVSTAFRSATVDRLPALAAAEAGLLTARWSDCGRYWSALAAAAARPDAAELRRIQLHGLQLAAAARLA